VLSVATSWVAIARKERPDGRGSYGRKSQNRDGHSKSVIEQLAEADAFNLEQDWRLNDELSFHDDNIPASEHSTKDRPGFNRLCDAIRTRKLWSLTVTEISRITRSMTVGVDFVKLAKKVGGVIIYTTEGKQYDLMTTTGEHDFYEAVVEASREVGRTSERVKRNKGNVAKRGGFNGGPIPFGRMSVIKDEDGQILNRGQAGNEIEPREAAIAKESLERIVAGWPLGSIVRDLQQRGETWRDGKPIVKQALRRSLCSPHMYGARTHHDRIEKEDAYPPIVSKELWMQAMAILSAEGRMKGSDKKGVRSYLLTGGIAICGCVHKNKMVGKAQPDHKGVSRRSYLCKPFDDEHNRIGCGRRRMAEPVELLVIDAVKHRLNSPGFTEALRRQFEEDKGHDAISALIAQAQTIQQRIDELEDAWTGGAGGLDLNSMLRMKERLQADLKSVNSQLQHHSKDATLSSLIGSDINDVFANADLAQLRAFMNLIVRRVTITPTERWAPRVKWTHEGTGKTFIFNPDLVKVDFKF
jgi:site-specific DNA recombinase